MISLEPSVRLGGGVCVCVCTHHELDVTLGGNGQQPMFLNRVEKITSVSGDNVKNSWEWVGQDTRMGGCNHNLGTDTGSLNITSQWQQEERGQGRLKRYSGDGTGRAR